MLSHIQNSSIRKNSHTFKGLKDIIFANTAAKMLPIEPNVDNRIHQVVGYVYSKVKPTPVKNPQIIALSQPCLELLDLDIDKVLNDPEAPLYLSGNKLLPGSEPIAHCYCGYQFGNWADQLGDGRAITIGDIFNHKKEIWELQLKGSGKTPYSRFGDGKAVLRSSIREFLCSEAMWALGIPTTRALSLIGTDTTAERDPFSTGEMVKEKCSVVIRVAPTFWRFGSFEIFKGSSKGYEKTLMPLMIEYILKYHYPELLEKETKNQWNRKDTVYELYCEITKRTAKLVALWQCYGFMHGVLNTDNMSIIGLTIDYGPFGWMDYFDKNYICNHSDQTGRYSYQNQPSVCKWNLLKLAEAFESVADFEKMKQFCEEKYDKLYEEAYYAKMREKIGLYCYESAEDKQLIDNLFDTMHDAASDFTKTFRKLNDYNCSNIEDGSNESDIIEALISYSADIEILKKQNKPNYSEADLQKFRSLAQINVYLLMAKGINIDILQLEEKKLARYKELLSINQDHLNKNSRERWNIWLKQYDKRLQKEMECIKQNSNIIKDFKASESVYKNLGKNFNTVEEWKNYRQERMKNINPIYILRNYMAEEVIHQAKEGNYQGVNHLLKLLLNPFNETSKEDISIKYKSKAPKWACQICISCSS